MLVITDRLSKGVILEPIAEITAEAVVDVFPVPSIAVTRCLLRLY